MTHYLGIITAYGAAAVLAWLAALLYPRLIPACAQYRVKNRWRQAALFTLAAALTIALAFLAGRGWLLTATNPLLAALNQCLIFTPVLVYLFSLRSREAALIPAKNSVRSLAIGFGIAVLALAAYYSSTSRWGDLPLLGEGLLSPDAIAIATRAILRSLLVAAFLSLVAGGWSQRIALGLAALAIALTQVPSLFEGGFTAEWLGLLVGHIALVTGLLSAILATRNIVWFWPVFFLLNLLQFTTS